MIINKIDNQDILELFQIECIDDKIRITTKNGATLLLSPKIQESIISEYAMEYLTGKENKDIAKLQNKIKELENQVANIKGNPEIEIDNDNDEVINEEERKTEI